MSEKEKLYEQNKGTGILYHVFDDGCNCMGCTGAAHWPDVWDCIPVIGCFVLVLPFLSYGFDCNKPDFGAKIYNLWIDG
jgi:hypothetical protein